MPLGFFKQPRLVIFGDGNGNIVIEEYEDDDCENLTARLVIDWDRFESIQSSWDELRSEAFKNFKG